MISCKRLFFLCILLLSSSFAWAVDNRELNEDHVQEKIIENLISGENLILSREYRAALKLFKQLQAQHPNSPAGYFGEMAVYEAQMLEREDFSLETKFLDAAKRGNKAVSYVLQRYQPNKWELMFVGSLKGLEGFIKARKRQWLRAYFLGAESRQTFNRIRQMDSKFTDADFGLGMYLYWRSVFAKKLNWLPFISDKRSEGIALIEKVAKHGRVAQRVATVNLAIIYLEEGRHQDAKKVATALVKEFPNNIFLRMILGRVYLVSKQYDRSLQQFHKVLEIYPKIYKAHYFIAVNLILQNNQALLGEANKELDLFLQANSNETWRSYALYWKGRIAEAKGKKKRAKSFYSAAIKLNSDLKGAKFRLRALGSGL